MNFKRLWWLPLLAALLLLACNFPSAVQTVPTPDLSTLPTPAEKPGQINTPSAPEKAPSNSACLVGQWQAGDLSPYILAAIPPDQAKTLTYRSTSGKAILGFTSPGGFSLVTEQLVFLFDTRLSFLTLPLKVSLDGPAKGTYEADNTTFSTKNVDTSQLNASALVSGQPVVEPSQIISVLPLVSPSFNTARYTCKGDNLSLKIENIDESLDPVILHRIK